MRMVEPQRQVSFGDDSKKNHGNGNFKCGSRPLRISNKRGKGKQKRVRDPNDGGSRAVGKGMGLIYLAHRIRNEHLPRMLGTKRAMGAYLCSA
jgi:hypothetical protein